MPKAPFCGFAVEAPLMHTTEVATLLLSPCNQDSVGLKFSCQALTDA